MADFSVAFRKGVGAAKIAERNREELDSVFEDLNAQLAKETGGSVAVEIRELQESPNIRLFDFLKALMTYEAIVAYNPKVEGSLKELAKWSEDRAGYPCKIKVGLIKEIYCEDKPALEAGLAELLEDPVVGEALYELIQLDADDKLTESSQPNGHHEGEATGEP